MLRYLILSCSMIYRERQGASIEAPCRSLSKKSGWCWAFSDRYGRMGKGDEKCWNAGKWIEIW